MLKHRLLTRVVLIGGLAPSALVAPAQDPAHDPDRPGAAANAPDLIARMMKFDTNSDGKLTRAEITDARLVRLWTRADADKDGSVTRTELDALDTKEQVNNSGGPRGFGGPGPGGPGGPMGAPPKPGEVLPPMMRARLKLTADQQQQLDDLQRDVDARLAKILTGSQKTQIKQMSTRGPGGPGGPGGGPGGPGGGPGGRGGGGGGGFDDGGPPPPPPQ